MGDVIIMADCLFFAEVHEDLLHCTTALLAPGGVIYSVSPDRDSTRAKFMTLAKEGGAFESIEEVENFHPAVWARHLELSQAGKYSKHRELPVLVVFRKKGDD